MKQVIGLLSICLFYCHFLPAQVDISIESKTVKVGEEFCLDVTVNGFQNILSFQAQFLHDDSLLTFTQFKHSSFPEALWDDPYAHDARIAWIAEDLINGASVENDSQLISLCYTANNSGVASISVFNDSTGLNWLASLPTEIYNAEEERIELIVTEAVIIIEEQDPISSKETSADSLSTSIVDPFITVSYEFFPNPIKDYLNIISLTDGHKEISLYTSSGQLISQAITKKKNFLLETGFLDEGAYYIVIKCDHQTISKPIIKL